MAAMGDEVATLDPVLMHARLLLKYEHQNCTKVTILFFMNSLLVFVTSSDRLGVNRFRTGVSVDEN